MLKPSLVTLFNILVLFLLSLVVLLPYKNGILANGESMLYLNPHYQNNFSSWEEHLNFGSISTYQANIFLFDIFWILFESLSFFAHPSVIFLFLALFLSSVFFYFISRDLFPSKREYIYLLPSILYTFNVFRAITPLNSGINLFFIFLPLLLFFYRKLLLTGRWLYVFILVIISVLSSSVGANPPLYIAMYFPLLILVLVYFLFKDTKKNLFVQHIVLFFLYILSNAFWLYPIVVQFLGFYKSSNGGANLFSALTGGDLFDHFRFIGSWAWKASHNSQAYYLFYKKYYNFILIISTFSIVLFSFVFLLSKDIHKRLLQNRNLMFVFLLSCISLLLSLGVNGPLALLSSFMYSHFPPLLLFREPFTKFMPVFVFSMSLLFTYSLDYIFSKSINLLYRGVLYILLLGMLLLNAFPLFDTSFMPLKRWNEGPWGYYVEIPEYWYDFKYFYQDISGAGRLLTLPISKYLNHYNWKFGLYLVGNAADFLVDSPVVRPFDADKSPSGIVLKSLSMYPIDSYDFPKFISLLGIKYVLQENDMLTDYSSRQLDISTQRYLLSKYLTLYKSFGVLSADTTYHNSINTDSSKVWGSPALDLYTNESHLVNSLFYISTKDIYVNGNTNTLPLLASIPAYTSSDTYFFNTNVSPDIFVSDFRLSEKPINCSYEKYSYPNTTVPPGSLVYLFVLSKEYFSSVLTTDPTQKIYKHLWNAQKRIVEYNKYSSDTGYYLSKYKREFLKAVAVLKDNYSQENIDILNMHLCTTYSIRPDFVSYVIGDFKQLLDSNLPNYDYKLTLDDNYNYYVYPSLVRSEYLSEVKYYDKSIDAKDFFNLVSFEKVTTYPNVSLENTDYKNVFLGLLEGKDSAYLTFSDVSSLISLKGLIIGEHSDGSYENHEIDTLIIRDQTLPIKFSAPVTKFYLLTDSSLEKISLSVYTQDFVNLLKVSKDLSFIPHEVPEMYYERLSPTKYFVYVKNYTAPFTLVFNSSYDSKWELKDYYSKEILSENKMSNGYSNSWHISSSAYSQGDNLFFVVEFGNQIYLNISLLISGVVILVSFIFILLLPIISYVKKYTKV